MEGFRSCFADLADPRRGDAQRHELDEIVMLALLAMVSGAESCVDVALIGRSKETLLHRFLRLPGGIPSHDTFLGGVPAARSCGLRGLLRALRRRADGAD